MKYVILKAHIIHPKSIMKQITQTHKYFAQKYFARIFFEYKSHHFPLSTKTSESVINEKQKM